MGIKFNIKSNSRIKKYYMSCDQTGIITFKFPLNEKNYMGFIHTYIENNYTNIRNMLNKISNNNKYIQDYIKKYPNKLNIFGEWYDIGTLSIDSLSSMLYEKSYKLLNKYSNIMKLSYSGLTISYAKTYLGQCVVDYIKIDYRNILLNEEILKYLVIHELSHIRHKNHSASFWNEVIKYYPNYKVARKELKLSTIINTEILKYYDLLPYKYKK